MRSKVLVIKPYHREDLYIDVINKSRLQEAAMMIASEYARFLKTIRYGTKDIEKIENQSLRDAVYRGLVDIPTVGVNDLAIIERIVNMRLYEMAEFLLSDTHFYKFSNIRVISAEQSCGFDPSRIFDMRNSKTEEGE